MNRRDFLQSSVLYGAAISSTSQLLAQGTTPNARGSAPGAKQSSPTVARPQLANGDWRQPSCALRGVNLGAWLVLEKWMTPSLFARVQAGDEWSFSQTLGAQAKIERHRATWITEADFKWIKDAGLDAVRVPLGYWALEEHKPYFSAARHVDNAFAWAAKYGLQVLLDLHAAPGSQNGWDHSGRSGAIEWPKPENVRASLRSLEIMAERYGRHPNLWGIECLNEPRWDVPLDVLKPFYQDAYKRMRPHLPLDRAVVFHDGFRPFDWQNFMKAPEYENVVLDTHIYQAYTEEDRKRMPQQHIQRALERPAELDKIKAQAWTMVGEWSNAIAWDAVKNLPPLAHEATKRGYGAAQLLSYEGAHAWFYWSLKTENGGDWSLQDSARRGLLPAKFQG